MNDKVQCFYLLGGLEMIARVVEEDATHIKVNNLLAFRLEQRRAENGDVQIAVQLIPPTMYADVDQSGLKETQLNKNMIVFNYPPTAEVLDRYNQATTGLIIARGSLPGANGFGR